MISFKQMSLTQRVGFILSILIIIGLTVGAFLWLTQKSYSVLFSDLEARDASRIVEQLDKMKADYQLSQSGTEILVPDSQVHQLRLKLMGDDIALLGGVGFELFDNSDLGMTEFAQRINYQRAIEGELTRTIMSLSEVKYARVHIVMPEKGLFQEDDSPPSASVTLFLKKNLNNISESQIAGIQRLVAASVPHMQPGQVIVTDDKGVTLSQSTEDGMNSIGVTNRLKQKQAFESYLNDKLNQVLFKTFGPNLASASVDVDLNFNEVKKTMERVISAAEPGSGISKKRETIVKNGTGKKATEQKISTEVDYQLGREVEQIVEKPGDINRLTVSLLIPESLSDNQVSQIEQLIKNTIGLDESRGDKIAIYPVAVVESPVRNEQAVSQSLSDALIEKQLDEDENKVIADKWTSQQIIIGFSVLLVCALMLTIILRISRQNQQSNEQDNEQLSDDERKQLLSTIQSWLNESKLNSQHSEAQ